MTGIEAQVIAQISGVATYEIWTLKKKKDVCLFNLPLFL